MTSKDAGKHVIYIDEMKVEHDALVETTFGSKLEDKNSINLIYIVPEKGEDMYGAQKQHETSVVHLSMQSAKARCWKLSTE